MGFPLIRIDKVPAQFCQEQCNTWNKDKKRCNKRRERHHCDHPELRQVRRYMTPLKRRRKQDRRAS